MYMYVLYGVLYDGTILIIKQILKKTKRILYVYYIEKKLIK